MLTGDPIYWSPMKPRVNLYEIENTAYDTPRYSYDAWTEAGSSDQLIGLSFETSITNVGQCFFTVEDQGASMRIDEHLTKGGRIKIDLTRDGTNYQTAYKGLMRAIETEGFGIDGRNITITGYNYLVRLGERVLKVNKESSKTGNDYDRTDSSMFANNLIENLVSSNVGYVYSDDDFGILGYDMAQYGAISDSSVTTWIPKLDIEYGTLASAIDEVLENAGALLHVRFDNDQLTLYDPEQNITGMQVFVITNQVNKLSDDADITMYPLESSKYRIGIDNDSSANRLIMPFKHPDSHPQERHQSEREYNSSWLTAAYTAGFEFWNAASDIDRIWGWQISVSQAGSPGIFRCALYTTGNCSGISRSSMKSYVRNDSAGSPGTQVDGARTMYPQETDGTFKSNGSSAFPSASGSEVLVGHADNDNVATLLPGKTYWVFVECTGAQSDANFLGAIAEQSQTAGTRYTENQFSSYSTFVTSNFLRFYNIPPENYGEPELNLDWLVVARDATTVKNFGGWLGYIEKTISSIPQHINGLQTMQEYLYPRIYQHSKPKIHFDYPSLTMPNKVPKAGDICVHYDSQHQTGTSANPQNYPGPSAVQTSVISDIRYDFDQDAQGVLGLRKLSLSTAGIRRGMY